MQYIVHNMLKTTQPHPASAMQHTALGQSRKLTIKTRIVRDVSCKYHMPKISS